LIRAIRRPQRDTRKAIDRYQAFKERLGIEPALERLLDDL
jgi:hypothetical protein